MRVAIIGAGVIGCATTYYLTRTLSCEITVIESEHVAYGASGYSAGFLTPYSGSNSPGLLALSPRALELHAELAESLPEQTGIDHGYDLKPFLRCGFGDEGIEQAQVFMVARRSEGLSAEWLTGDEARAVCDWVSDEVAGACITEIEPTLDSALLTKSLLDAATKSGNVNVVKARASGVKSSSDGTVASVSLEDGSHAGADAFVFAVGPWSADVGGWLGFDLPVNPENGQLLHVALGTWQPNGPPPCGMQNMDDGGVVLPRRVSSTVLGATREDRGFDVEATDFAYEYILPRVERLCPRVSRSTVSHQTSCLRPMPSDGKPYVGLAPGWDNAYVAAGHWSEGVHFGPLTGKIVSDLVTDGGCDVDLTAISTERLSPS